MKNALHNLIRNTAAGLAITTAVATTPGCDNKNTASQNAEEHQRQAPPLEAIQTKTVAKITAMSDKENIAEKNYKALEKTYYNRWDWHAVRDDSDNNGQVGIYKNFADSSGIYVHVGDPDQTQPRTVARVRVDLQNLRIQDINYVLRDMPSRDFTDNTRDAGFSAMMNKEYSGMDVSIAIIDEINGKIEEFEKHLLLQQKAFFEERIAQLRVRFSNGQGYKVDASNFNSLRDFLVDGHVDLSAESTRSFERYMSKDVVEVMQGLALTFTLEIQTVGYRDGSIKCAKGPAIRLNDKTTGISRRVFLYSFTSDDVNQKTIVAIEKAAARLITRVTKKIQDHGESTIDEMDVYPVDTK